MVRFNSHVSALSPIRWILIQLGLNLINLNLIFNLLIFMQLFAI